MKNDLIDVLGKLSRENMHEIWEHAKKNEIEDLSEEEKKIAEIMMEHEDEYSTHFEFSDITSDYKYDPETEVNPFLHITIHSIIENQLESRDPIEVYQFYLAMQKKKVSHHDTIHLAGTILMPFIFDTIKNKKEFDLKSYKQLLKKYKDKKPDKIISSLDKDLSYIFE